LIWVNPDRSNILMYQYFIKNILSLSQSIYIKIYQLYSVYIHTPGCNWGENTIPVIIACIFIYFLVWASAPFGFYHQNIYKVYKIGKLVLNQLEKGCRKGDRSYCTGVPHDTVV
jgi:hypothetical protein